MFRVWRLMIVVLFVTLSVQAQIYAPAASDSFGAAYNIPGGTDQVFIFNTGDFGQETKAILHALPVDRTGGWSFQWFVYSLTDSGYLPVLPVESGFNSSIDSITVPSGYQIVMSKGIVTDTFRVWVAINDFDVIITNKDAEGKLQFGYYNCSSLDLRADTFLISPFYYNPFTHARVRISNTFSIRWRTNPSGSSTPPSRLITRVGNPPAEDTWYILRVTDRFSLIREDSVYYKSIQSKAQLTGEYVPLSDTAEYPNTLYAAFYDDDVFSAPGKYRFDLTGSRNSIVYRIDFGDGEWIETSNDSAQVVHEYKLPGTYKAVLTTKSEKPFECIDSVSVEASLRYAAFVMPNVFSPNGDGNFDELKPENFDELKQSNDVFRSGDVSIISVDITIFDRAGQKVHNYAGNMRDWNGWDGRIRQSNREAPEGVYYYVINVLYGYEDKSEPVGRDVLKGFFHLFRE